MLRVEIEKFRRFRIFNQQYEKSAVGGSGTPSMNVVFQITCAWCDLIYQKVCKKYGGCPSMNLMRNLIFRWIYINSSHDNKLKLT